MEMELNLGEAGERMAYLKPVSVDQLPDSVREEAGERKHVFSVHNAEGTQIALIADQDLAFNLADEFDVALQRLH